MIKNSSVKETSTIKNKVALITGITGQDGSYLAEFLLKKNYTYMALKEGCNFNTQRIDHIYRILILIIQDLYCIMVT